MPIRVLNSFLFPAMLIMLLWLIQLYQWDFDKSLFWLGIYPRSIKGLPGILTSPLIHASFTHLLSNTLPLFLLGAGLIFFYREVAIKVFVLIYLFTDILVWIIARPSYHIGASGVIYGLATFLFFSGIFKRYVRLLGISMIIMLFYGSMVWGVLPTEIGVSWEAHLSGAVVGMVCAYLFRKQGPVRERYAWEDEPDDENNRYMKIDDYYELPPRDDN